MKGLLVLCLCAVAAAVHAAPITLVAIGDSITWGVTRSARAPGTAPERDREGGYPGRLSALLGSEVRVVNRGLSGSTTTDWLGRPLGLEMSAVRGLLASAWPDFRPAREAEARESLLDWVLANERPQLAIVLLGVNDLFRGRVTKRDAAPRLVAARVVKVVHRVRRVTPRVLVATLLPNRRDPETALEAVNARLCELEPDCVRLDAAFRTAGGLDLLGDEIHPSEAGYAAIAQALAKSLAHRGRVR